MNDEQVAQLLEAIRQQTAAITRLADSNAALVAAMADADGMDDEGRVSIHYLDGSPCA
ncbi:MAG: hypothetical protein ACI92B_000941 [Marinobacter maritimus]|jgi:hypothetical protein